jgi:hypothetical protein
MILPELSMVPQDKMSAVLDKQLIASNNCFSMFNGSPCPLPNHLQNLLFQVNDSKVKKSNEIDNKYLKVVKALEKGVAMFSGEHNETVLVKAPVMFIAADNPAHSDICGIQQQTTLYFCRKCYVRKSSKKKNCSLLESGITVESLNCVYNNRSRNHYILAASDCSRKNVQIVDALEAGALNACDLSFKNTGSQDLLLLCEKS